MEQSDRQVNIKTISGEVKSLTVPSNLPIPNFKQKISEAFNVPADKQRLISQGKLLKDEATLADYVKEDGQFIHLMIRADGPPPAAPSSSSSAPQNSGAPPVNMPFQFDQLINSMVGSFIPGAQIFPPGGAGRPATVNINLGQGFIPPQGVPQNPPGSAPPVHSHHAQSIPAHGGAGHGQQAHPPNGASNPRAHVEISLPFDRLHNIGAIINELHGNNSSFPPPRMPQLPFQRNPMTLLGGYLHNYEFQVLRFLPFISRVSDLLQRESLITDPEERVMLQNMAQRVSAGLNELAAATAPVAGMLGQLQVGQAPGQFQLRIGNMNVAPEVRPASQPPQPVPNPANTSNVPNPANLPPNPSSIPNPLAAFAQMAGNPMAGLGQMAGNPMAGLAQMAGNPFQMLQNSPQNVFSAVMPMFSQILGANQTMTLRDLINTLQIHDEEESLPMMDFFYNLNISEVMGLAAGNWEPIERQRGAVRESLIKLMEGDSPEGRHRIVQILVGYMQRQYSVPAQFNDRILNNFDPQTMISRIGENWLAKLVSHVMDYEGPQFVSEFKRILFMLIGNYTYEMREHIQGGLETVLAMVQVQMQTAMGRIIPPEMSGMVDGLLGGVVNGYLTSSVGLYEQWLATSRTQEEAKESLTPAGALLATWQETIARDMEHQIIPQAPFSSSYLASDIFLQSRLPTPSLSQIFANTFSSALGDSGQTIAVDSAPSPVFEEFLRNFTAGVRERLRNDPDYRNGRFEHLDRIHK